MIFHANAKRRYADCLGVNTLFGAVLIQIVLPRICHFG